MKSLVAKDPAPANEIGARKPRLERRTEALSRATLLALSPVPSTRGECNRLEDTGNEKTSETGENLSRFIPFSAACEHSKKWNPMSERLGRVVRGGAGGGAGCSIVQAARAGASISVVRCQV